MTTPIVNPYKRNAPAAQRVQEMGPQSQRRISMQQRGHRLAANNNPSRKKRKTGQRTLTGEVAFDPLEDCPICSARHYGSTVPHTSHDDRCIFNTKTRGIVSATTQAQREVDKQLKRHFSAPLLASEKGSWRHSTKEAGEAFFARRKNIWKPPSRTPAGRAQSNTCPTFFFF